MRNSPESKFKIVIMLILFVVSIGTAGYILLAHQNFLNALFMTVISITTVGYREVFELTTELKIFTIFIILSGVAVIFYGVTVLMQMAVEGQLLSILGRRKMLKEVKKLKNHVIIAGYGRVGQIVQREFEKRGKRYVVIENQPGMVEDLQKRGVPHVIGNSTEDEVLIAAGVERAEAIVSAIPSEADNVYLSLTAKQLNPDIKVIARSDTTSEEKKLYRAGADKVICPHKLGGMRMAISTLRPNVVDFMEVVSTDGEMDISIEEVIVTEGSPLDGVSLKDSDLKKKLDLMVVAIKKEDRIHFNPSANTKIEVGNVLILIGSRENLLKFDQLSGEESPQPAKA